MRKRSSVESPPTPPRTDRMTASDDTYAPMGRAVRMAFTLAPLAGFGLILLITTLVVGGGAAGFVASMALGAFVGGGKLVILAGAVDQAPVGPWAIAALIVYIDLATCFLVLGGLHLLYKIPGAGKRIAAARDSGSRLLERHPSVRRGMWLSVAGFIAVPFNGTGALVGTVLGRLLGLSRLSTVTAIGFGSVVGSTALAAATDYWEEHISQFANEPLIGAGLIVAIVGVSMVWSRWARRRSMRKDPKISQLHPPGN